MLWKIYIAHVGKYGTLGKNKFTDSIDSEVSFASIFEEFKVHCFSSEMAKDS